MPVDALEREIRESTEILPNPERGFYAQRRSDRIDRLDALRGQGLSLLLVTFDLRDYKERALTDEKLHELSHALATARTAGFKVIFRAAYGFTNKDYRADPPDLTRIVGHIRQIATVLADERDALCAIQAGMLGPWGEWHGSNHGNPPSLEARRAVLFAWLDAVPAPIPVQVRRPMFIRDIFASEPGGFTLTPENAFNDSRLARTGWHNDAFLVPPSDLGTYAERGWSRARELEWCATHGRFTPFGGETVHTDTPLPLDAAVREMEQLHATYLNIGYHPKVLQLWRENEYRGENLFAHIARRLGYRLVPQRLRTPRVVRRGTECNFELALRNAGFAAPISPRVLEAALFSGEPRRPAVVAGITGGEPRHWGPERNAIVIRGAMRVPADLPRGPCCLALRLADPATRLRDDARFAIRLAGAEIDFLSHGGWNVLTHDLAVV